MESLTKRERVVMSAITGFARQFGRWGSVRELGDFIAAQEGREALSVASTVAALHRKGYIARQGRNYALKDMRLEVKVRLVAAK